MRSEGATLRSNILVSALMAALFAGMVAPAVAAPPQTLIDLETAVADVAEKVKPSVVSLTSERELDEDEDSPLTLPRRPGTTPRFPLARGSGLLFRATDEHYYILTNAHVVRGARGNKVNVKLVTDTVKRQGVVMGVDRPTDTAVVRMDRKPGDNLPLVSFGKAKVLRVGSFVLAIGSPFDFEASVTLGIVSSLDRELEEPVEGRPVGYERAVYSGLIQTDASINPGNSGGPLVNMRGEVVGINFAIFSPGMSGSNIGIGFAIPIERALAVVDDLITKGHAVRGYLGVKINDADYFISENNVTIEDVKAMYGTTDGAFVGSVQPDTPAGRAGLQAGDVIVAIDGQPVKSVRELQDRVRDLRPGTQVKLNVLRDRQPMELNVTLAELPAAVTGDELPVPGTTPAPAPAVQSDPLGLRVQELTAQQAAELKIPQGYGVRVTGVEPDGLAAEKGLTAGAVIVEGRVGGGEAVPFRTVQAYRDFIAKAKADEAFVELRVSVAEGNTRVLQRITVSFREPAEPDLP